MILNDLPDHDYHQRPELSSTGARRILDSPARYRYWADHPEPPKAAFDLGSAAHAKILGVGAGVIEYPREYITPSGEASKSKAALAWVAEQRAHGLIPISATDARRIDRMAEAVLADREARSILERIPGREVTIIQEVDGVPMRARFDIYGDGKAADLKTCRDASPKGFNRSVGSYGYAIQSAWYSEAHEAETGRPLDEPFWFLCVEAAAPHLVGVYDLDFMWQDIARTKTAKAREIYRACFESNTWPAYGMATLTPPTWAVYENEEQEIQV